MANEIDRLMDLDPLDLSAQDIDQIVAYQQSVQANYRAGIKPKKSGEVVTLDLKAMGLIPKSEPIKRRF